MPEDIEKMLDDEFDAMDTLEWEPPADVWYVIGLDSEDEDPSEADLVVEALNTANTKEPWYEKLLRDLS